MKFRKKPVQFQSALRYRKHYQKLLDDYIKNRYHGVEDEYDPSWSLEGTAQVAQFALKTGLYLANKPTMPEWHNGDPFKKIREKSILEMTGH